MFVSKTQKVILSGFSSARVYFPKQSLIPKKIESCFPKCSPTFTHQRRWCTSEAVPKKKKYKKKAIPQSVEDLQKLLPNPNSELVHNLRDIVTQHLQHNGNIKLDPAVNIFVKNCMKKSFNMGKKTNGKNSKSFGNKILQINGI
jgi:hypothetical protein